jgi:hypothetical protein
MQRQEIHSVMILNAEWDEMEYEATVRYFEALYGHLSGRIEENSVEDVSYHVMLHCTSGDSNRLRVIRITTVIIPSAKRTSYNRFY